ncbi:hypothetical protein AOLI_G00036830 [Acnodon oligacanthus]
MSVTCWDGVSSPILLTTLCKCLGNEETYYQFLFDTEFQQLNSSMSCHIFPFHSVPNVISGWQSGLQACRFSTCEFPSTFKTERVLPILKKPTIVSFDANNYRLVSLLSLLSKILEHAVYNQLSLFLTQNQLQDPNQSGFKPAHSTETALIAVTEKLQSVRSAKLSSVLIILDLSAAFDTVKHIILLDILGNLGITGYVWKWFESYLEDRSYQVSSRILSCLSDISSWMAAHHLKLSPSNTELIFIPTTTGSDPSSPERPPRC